MIEHGLNNNEIYDLSVYDQNKVLFTPLTTLKHDGKKHPPLMPVDCDVFKTSASYILEEYEDWDVKFQVDGTPQPKAKAKPKKVIQEDNDDDETPNKYYRLSNLIKLVNQVRARAPLRVAVGRLGTTPLLRIGASLRRRRARPRPRSRTSSRRRYGGWW